MTIDPDRRAALLATKLGVLVRERWGIEPRTLGFAAGVAATEGTRAWVLLDDDPARRLGGALAWARRAGAEEVHLLVDDPAAAGVLARRAEAFRRPPAVWLVEGRTLVSAVPSSPAPFAAPHPAAELEATLLVDAGLEVVVEQGEVIGEVLGLEVARVVIDVDSGEEVSRIEAGVGRFDREAFALMHPDLATAAALDRVIRIVRTYRRPDAEPHPLNQLVPERWLRAGLIADPSPVGAAELHAVTSVRPRSNLRETMPATAVGTGSDGEPIVVVCSTGVDLELVPVAADDRMAHSPGARLILAVPDRDVLPVTTALASELTEPATVVGVPSDWKSWA